jgi:hypothetical protein
MMPFARDLRRRLLIPIPNLAVDIYNHPAIDAWVINQDRSVTVPEAGIIASCPRRGCRKISDGMYAVIRRRKYGGPARRFRGTVEFNTRLCSFRPGTEK